VGTLPAPLIATARGYILPAVFGAVVLQSVMAMKSRRTTIVAVVVAALIVFVVVPLVPALTYYATALAVIITIAVSWFARSKTPPSGPAATTGVASPAAHIPEPTR
jgi:predicted branched-subunit amino acid permease